MCTFIDAAKNRIDEITEKEQNVTDIEPEKESEERERQRE